MAGINPIAYAQEEDIVRIGGKISPGICKISGFERKYGWDKKKGSGVKGSTLTLNEYPPAEGTITFFLWEPSHFDEWRIWSREFMYDGTKKAVNAVDIYNQSLEVVGITRVVCSSVSPWTNSGKGLYSVTVGFIEYNPPPKKSASNTPNSSKSTTGKTPGDPDLDARMAQIAENNRLIRAARGEDKPASEWVPQRGA